VVVVVVEAGAGAEAEAASLPLEDARANIGRREEGRRRARRPRCGLSTWPAAVQTHNRSERR